MPHLPPQQVLAEVGPEGMNISELVNLIQSRGYRNLRKTCKQPEASVSGALARDVVFARCVGAADHCWAAMLP